MKTLAIVGASLAGLSAGRAARAQGFTGRLVIIGDEPHRPYDRPPLSKDFLLSTVTVEDLALESDTDELEAEYCRRRGGWHWSRAEYGVAGGLRSGAARWRRM